MFFYLLLLFVLIPFIELALLLWVAEHIGWLETLLLIVLTGILGASLARWQGVQTLRRIRQQAAEGEMPADGMIDGLLILIAGAVLLTPGVLTDLCGFALLVPSLRRLFKRAVSRWFERNVHIETRQYTSTGWTTVDEAARRDEIIEGRVIETRVDDVPPAAEDD